MNRPATTNALEAARTYLACGYTPVPVPRGAKGPVLKGWHQLRPTEADLPGLFAGESNIGLVLGEPSGGLVDVDLDCDEAIELADEYLPPTPAITGRGGKPRSHRWYVAEGASTRQFRDRDKSMIVELRSTGGQTLVGPSIHPDSGDQYEPLGVEPAVVPSAMLLACVEALASEVRRRRHGDEPEPGRDSNPSIHVSTNHTFDRSPDVERRAIAYLAKCPPAIEGQGGHDTTFSVATALVHGFGLEPKRALDILLTEYNPRCEPEWKPHELEHKVESAASTPHSRPFGWLRDGGTTMHTPIDAGVDLSGILNHDSPQTPKPSKPDDPGPIPDELLHVPGFVADVVEFTLANAPYPNLALAFCGAIALQSYLCGRKVRDPGDLRANLYLLALAASGTGKDFPRKVNARIMYDIGHVHALGDKFASGEGLQDALLRGGAMLFQNDEMDGVLRQINLDRENKKESIPNVLLTLYTSAGDVYPIRVRAGQKDHQHIDQPHLTLFGTATPQYFYESLSQRMLTNGFFARMMVVDVGKRGAGQKPGSVRRVPELVLDAARWWAEFQPGTQRRNLLDVHPEPVEVPYTDDADLAITELQRTADAEYERADEKNDEVARVAWSRTAENARKLAMLHACSTDREHPRITLPAVEWASRFAIHQTRRQLHLASIYVAENPFHAECLKLIRKLEEAGELTRSQCLRVMRCKAQDLDQIVGTLIEQGDVLPVTIPTRTNPACGYRIAG